MKKNRTEILQLILILLVGGQILFSVFGNSGESQFVRDSLEYLQDDMTLVSDTLSQLKQDVERYGEIFQANQIELAILRKERRLLEIAQQKQQVRNHQELKELQVALQKEQEIHQRLIERARKFEK
jgi:uncharacterized protein YxeA